MPLDPEAMGEASLTAETIAALKGMEDDLTDADRGVVRVILAAAQEWDKAVAEGKSASVMNYLSYVSNGLEKLGGSVAARKALGKKPDKPKSGLAGVRNLRAVPDAAPAKAPAKAAAKPRAPRKPRAPKAKGA